MPLYDSAVVKVYFITILHLALPKLMLLCTVQCSSSLSRTPLTPHPCLQLYKLWVLCLLLSVVTMLGSCKSNRTCLFVLLVRWFDWYKWCKYDVTVAFSSAIKTFMTAVKKGSSLFCYASRSSESEIFDNPFCICRFLIIRQYKMASSHTHASCHHNPIG